MSHDAPSLESLNEQQLRELARTLMHKIDKLSHELAILRRLRFGRISEQLDAAQGQLFEEDALSDVAAIEAELAQIALPRPAAPKNPPHRQALPAHLPRTEIRHEPDNTQCACGCQLQRIGEDISEKLDYTPGTFTVERHVRGRWVSPCVRLVVTPIGSIISGRDDEESRWHDMARSSRNRRWRECSHRRAPPCRPCLLNWA